MPISREEARAEALVSAADGGLVLATLEIWHPTFIENGQQTPVYFVHDEDDLTATIEPQAERNPGATVVFRKSAFSIVLPASDESGSGRGMINVSDVKGQLYSYSNRAIITNAPFVFIFREYLGNDLSQPSQYVGPFILRKITAKGTTISGEIAFEELDFIRVPRLTSSDAEFPGLRS